MTEVHDEVININVEMCCTENKSFFLFLWISKQNALSTEVASKTGRFYSSITLLLHTWTTGLILPPYNVTIIRKSICLCDELCFPDLKQVVIALKMAETVYMDQLDKEFFASRKETDRVELHQNTPVRELDGKKTKFREGELDRAVPRLLSACQRMLKHLLPRRRWLQSGAEQQEISMKERPANVDKVTIFKIFHAFAASVLGKTFTFQKYSQVHKYLD